tara:strand:+ start:2839 stop:3399 length:561 start_codon:yes stop_codon:yes gene_type:complete
MFAFEAQNFKSDVDVRVKLFHTDYMIKPVSPAAEFTIRDLAAEFGVTARTLRFYEQKGLLSPSRRGAARIYSATDRARLLLILRGKRVGFSLDEIREMLELEAITNRDPQALGETLARFRGRIAALESQREDIDAAIEELEGGCQWIEERLADREPSDDIKHRARAFEALASARMNPWTGAAPESA